MDDQWSFIRWRGAVKSAIRGKRGQSFLREMIEAMDALPERKLVANELQSGDQVCAIGAVGKSRGIDMGQIDPEDYATVAALFGISDALAQEIVFMNDEAWIWSTDERGIQKDAQGKSIRLTPEQRFEKMRSWVSRHLKDPVQS